MELEVMLGFKSIMLLLQGIIFLFHKWHDCIHSSGIHIIKMGVILVVFIIILKFICQSNCTTPSHIDHICVGGTTTEQAGRSSGTLSFDGTSCEFTLTNITELSYLNTVPRGKGYQMNILNIVGVIRSQRCNSSLILIRSESYCLDNTVKDTLFNVTDKQITLSVVSMCNQAKPFTLEYYKGKMKNVTPFSSFHILC